MTIQRALVLCLLGWELLCAGFPAFAQKADAEALIKEADETFNRGFDSGKDVDVQARIAADRLEFALAADPQSMVARLRLAYLYLDFLRYDFEQDAERTEFVRRTYHDALAGDPNNPLLLWDTMIVEFEAHHYLEAWNLARKLIAIDPNSRRANTALAVLTVWQADGPVRGARVAARMEPSGAEPLRDAAARARLRREYMPEIDAGMAAARKALTAESEEPDTLLSLWHLLEMKSTLSDPAEAHALMPEIATFQSRVEKAMSNLKEKMDSDAQRKTWADQSRLRPGEPPPPADESLLIPPIPPPPPPPPPPSPGGPKPPPRPYKDLDPDDVILADQAIPAAVHPHRALVLSVWSPAKQDRGPLTPDNPYTCEEHSLGSYYVGRPRLSLADTQTRTFINTIYLYDPKDPGSHEYRAKLPYRIAPGPYPVNDKLVEGEGKPDLLHLEDYNGDGQPLEVAFFKVNNCSETMVTLGGYSRKQDKVIHYRFILEKDAAAGGGYVNSFWIPNLLSQKPDQPGHWKYTIDHPSAGVGAEQIEIRYDADQEIFRGTISGN